MRQLPLPTDSFEDVYALCTAATVDVELRARLLGIAPTLHATVARYDEKARLADLHSIERRDAVGDVTKAELRSLYKTHLSATKGAARAVYDRIRSSAPHNKCPLCGVGTVAHCDHHLPQSKYPDLVVVPFNLVPVCHYCNDRKRATHPANAGQQTFHPYYDQHLLLENWVWAEIRRGAPDDPPVLVFEARPPATWPQDDQERVKHHFKVCGLVVTFATNANDELSILRSLLEPLGNAGGQDAVRDHLNTQRDANAGRLNSWQYAMFRALASDAWFVGGGYLLIP